MAEEAGAEHLLPDGKVSEIQSVKGAKILGSPVGNWLNRGQTEHLLALPDTSTFKGKRDHALLGLLIRAIDKLVITEIIPAARAFQNKLAAIDEGFFGNVAKGIIGAAGGTSLLQLFGDLSRPKLIAAAGAGAAYVANAAIDNLQAKKVAKRECSISYILALDD